MYWYVQFKLKIYYPLCMWKKLTILLSVNAKDLGEAASSPPAQRHSQHLHYVGSCTMAPSWISVVVPCSAGSWKWWGMVTHRFLESVHWFCCGFEMWISPISMGLICTSAVRRVESISRNDRTILFSAQRVRSASDAMSKTTVTIPILCREKLKELQWERRWMGGDVPSLVNGSSTPATKCSPWWKLCSAADTCRELKLKISLVEYSTSYVFSYSSVISVPWARKVPSIIHIVPNGSKKPSTIQQSHGRWDLCKYTVSIAPLL